MPDAASIGMLQKVLFGAAVVVTAAGAYGALWMTVAETVKGVCILTLVLALCAAAGGRLSGWVGIGPATAMAFLAAFACVATHPGFAGVGGRLDAAPSVARAAMLGLYGACSAAFAAYAFAGERRRAGKYGDPAIVWAPMVLAGGAAAGAIYGAALLPASRALGAGLGALSMLGAVAVGWVVFCAVRAAEPIRAAARSGAADGGAVGGCSAVETASEAAAIGEGSAPRGGATGATRIGAWGAKAARAAAIGCAICLLLPAAVVAVRRSQYVATVREGLEKFEKGDIGGAAASFREAGSLMAALGDPGPLAAAQGRVSDILESRGDFSGSRAAWLARLRTLGLPPVGDLRLMALKLASGDDADFWDAFVRRGEAVFSDRRIYAAIQRRAEAPGAVPRILYAAAAARLAVGDRAGAVSLLRRLLSTRPDDGCALYMLETILRMEGRGAEADAERGKRHNIHVRDMAGDMTYFPNITSDFAARIHLPAGRYAATCRVLGMEARGEWPILEVYLDDALVYSAQVRRPEWHEVGFEFEVERGGSFLLRLVYPNDLYEVLGNIMYNRNLMLEGMSIEPAEVGAAPGKAGGGT